MNNLKKLLLPFVVVYAVSMILNLLIHGAILGSTYESPELSDIMRPAEESKMWIHFIVGIIFSFFFVFIFSKGYENRGIMEGVRYGLYVGLMVATPMAYSSYAAYQIPYSLALQWFIYGLVYYIILGVIAALLYKLKVATAPAAS
ncbi:MAG: hypothetical protein ACE5H0_11365 [Bacteroidota bacterium]